MTPHQAMEFWTKYFKIYFSQQSETTTHQLRDRIFYLERFVQEDSFNISIEDKLLLVTIIDQIRFAEVEKRQSLSEELINRLSQIDGFASAFRASNVHREPFNRSLFSKYSDTLSEHIYSEQVLNVMSDGHWHPEKFGTSTLDPDYVPGKDGLQFRLPYVLLPQSDLGVLNALQSNDLLEQFEITIENIKYYILFFHPTMLGEYQIFSDAHQYTLVYPIESEYLAAPTSSYRSLVVIKTIPGDENSFKPVIIKVGVHGQSVGCDRFLWHESVYRSVFATELFDQRINDFQLKIEAIPESIGLIYKDIPKQEMTIGHYKKYNHSPINMLVREIPKDLLVGAYNYYSMAALYSVHSENKPLIYRLAFHYLNATPEKSLSDFLKEEIIDSFLTNAIDLLIDHGVSIEAHAQNLGVVVDSNRWKIERYFIRDACGYALETSIPNIEPNTFNVTQQLREQLGDEIVDKVVTDLKHRGNALKTNFIQEFSWFFGYQVIQKMLNVFIQASASTGRVSQLGLFNESKLTSNFSAGNYVLHKKHTPQTIDKYFQGIEVALKEKASSQSKRLEPYDLADDQLETFYRTRCVLSMKEAIEIREYVLDKYLFIIQEKLQLDDQNEEHKAFIDQLRDLFSPVEKGFNSIRQVYQTPAAVPYLIDFIKSRQAEINDFTDLPRNNT